MKNPIPSYFSIGFTGTQQGMNNEQLIILTDYLMGCQKFAIAKGYIPLIRHGDCIGADDQAARTAKFLGYTVVAYPCIIPGRRTPYRAYCPASDWGYTAAPPLERNQRIVEESDYIVACPKETEDEVRQNGEPLRSGTWATIRYARKQKKHVFIIYA